MVFSIFRLMSQAIDQVIFPSVILLFDDTDLSTLTGTAIRATDSRY